MAAPTLLVCDDEEVLRDLVRATFEGEGFNVVEAQDGSEALEQARRRHPDLMVIDMMMPGASGLQTLRELRRDPELSSTPVIMLTARTQIADRTAAVEAGADYYLAKPFSPLRLAELAGELLENVRQAA
jgi:two-component system phosphate regulon response regulator PhoB